MPVWDFSFQNFLSRNSIYVFGCAVGKRLGHIYCALPSFGLPSEQKQWRNTVIPHSFASLRVKCGHVIYPFLSVLFSKAQLIHKWSFVQSSILYHPFYWEPRVLTLGSVSFTSVAELTHNFASLHINDISVILCPQAVSVSHRPCYGQTVVDNAVSTSRVIIDSVHDVIPFL